jgi:hypothetical protein
MDLEIKEFSQTLAVGGIAVYCFYHFITFWRADSKGRNARDKSNITVATTKSVSGDKTNSNISIAKPKNPGEEEKKGDQLSWQTSTFYFVVFAIVLAAGLVLQDASKTFSSGRAQTMFLGLERGDCRETKIRLFENRFIGSDDEIKMRCLFQKVVFEDGNFKGNTTPLLDELNKSKLMFKNEAVLNDFDCLRRPASNAISVSYEPVEYFPEPFVRKTNYEEVWRLNEEANVRRLEKAVDGAYYAAHNIVYCNTEYFQELSEIAARLDFTRSLTLVFLCMLFLYAFAYPISRFAVDPTLPRFWRVLLRILWPIIFVICLVSLVIRWMELGFWGSLALVAVSFYILFLYAAVYPISRFVVDPTFPRSWSALLRALWPTFCLTCFVLWVTSQMELGYWIPLALVALSVWVAYVTGLLISRRSKEPWQRRFRKQRQFALIFPIVVLFFAGWFLSYFSYRIESINYDLRVFGYYISLSESSGDNKHNVNGSDSK